MCADRVKQALVVYSPEAANPSYLDQVLGQVTRRLCEQDFYNLRVVPLYEHSSECLLFNYEHFDIIIAIGGDKTARCVLESLAQTQSKVPVGLLPMGSDTLLGAKLGIKNCNEREDVDEALDTIFGGNRFAMDLGKVNGRYFAIDAVIGEIPPVVMTPESNIPRNFGVLSHLAPFVQSIGKRSFTCRFLFEDEGFYRLASSIFVTNARGIGTDGGGDVKELSDGYLYLCIVNPLSLGDYVGLAYRFGAWCLSGVVSGDAPLLIKKIKQVRIETDKEAPVMVDGESWGTSPVDIEVVPGAVEIFVPRLAEKLVPIVEKEDIDLLASDEAASSPS